MTLLAPSLQAFFTDRLMRQLQASGHTIRSYRATWRLLLLFAAAQTGKAPSELNFADLSAPLITSFLHHLEHQRGNTARTRNLRLAAIHSMFAYAAPQHPEHADDIARVLAVPGKRFRTTIITHLSEEEITALLQAPDPGTWTGRRDHALLLAAVTTGLRAGELAGLTRADTHLGDGPHLECHGKGRKDRVTPLLRDTVAVLAAWLGENPGGPGSPVFPTRRGTPMSQDAIEDCVKRHAATAAATCPSLTSKNVTPHVLRHSCAVRMQMGRIASDASFGSFREHALPAAQRADLRCPRPDGPPRGCGDLGLHGPPGSDATMMQLIPLRGPHHHCACWHRDASGSSRLHRVHRRRTRRAAPGRHRSCEGRAGPPPHWSRHPPDLAASRSRCT